MWCCYAKAVDLSPVNRYSISNMKQGIHPKLIDTLVHCNGCGTEFKTHSTVDKITVEICSNCHPFYTGKQKLVDVAGRVDRFKARQAAAQTKKAKSGGKAEATKTQAKDSTEQLKQLKKELEKSPAPAAADNKADQ